MKVLSYAPVFWKIEAIFEDAETLDYEVKLKGTVPQSASSPGVEMLHSVGAHIFTIDLPHPMAQAKTFIHDAVKGIVINGVKAYAWFATSALKRDQLVLTSVKLPGWFEACHGDVIRFGGFMAPCHLGVALVKQQYTVVADDYPGAGDGQSVLNMPLMAFEQTQFRAAISWVVGKKEPKFLQAKGTAIPGSMSFPSMYTDKKGEILPIGKTDGLISVGSIKPKGAAKVGDKVSGWTMIGFLSEGQASEGKVNPQYSLMRNSKKLEAIQRKVWPMLLTINEDMVSDPIKLASKFETKEMRSEMGAVNPRGIVGRASLFCKQIHDTTLLLTPYFTSQLRGIVDNWNHMAVMSGGRNTNRLRAMCLPESSIPRGTVIINPKTARKFGIKDAVHGAMCKVTVLRSPHVDERDNLSGYVYFDDRMPRKSIGMRAEDALCMGADFDGDDLDLLFPYLSPGWWGMAEWTHYRKVMRTAVSKGRASKVEVESLEEALWTVKSGKVGRPAVGLMMAEVAERMPAAKWVEVNERLARAKWKGEDEPFPKNITPEMRKEYKAEFGVNIAKAVDSAKQMSRVDEERVAWLFRLYAFILKVAGYTSPMGWRELDRQHVWVPNEKGQYMAIEPLCDGPHFLSEAWRELGTKLKPLGAITVSACDVKHYMPDSTGEIADMVTEMWDDHIERMTEVIKELRIVNEILSQLDKDDNLAHLDEGLAEYVGYSQEMADEEAEMDVSWLPERRDALQKRLGDVYQDSSVALMTLFTLIRDNSELVSQGVRRCWNLAHSSDRTNATLLWNTIPELVFNELSDLFVTGEYDMGSDDAGVEQTFEIFVPKDRVPASKTYDVTVEFNQNKTGMKRQTRLWINKTMYLTVRETTPLRAKDGDKLKIEIVKQISEQGFACKVCKRQTRHAKKALEALKVERVDEFWPELTIAMGEESIPNENMQLRSDIDVRKALKKAHKKADKKEKAEKAAIAAEDEPELDIVWDFPSDI